MTPNRYDARHNDKYYDRDRIIKYDRDNLKSNTEYRNKDQRSNFNSSNKKSNELEDINSILNEYRNIDPRSLN